MVAALASLVFMGGCVLDSPDYLRARAYTPDQKRNIATWMPAAILPGGQVLRKGDRITVYLKGIPKEEEIQTKINDLGEITLSFIQSVKVEGLTWPEAEKLVRRKYIEGEFFKDITVIIVGQEGEYYVSGEVQKPGEYMLAGEIHLTQAIARAGGYTDFADRRKVKVVRGQEFKIYNCEAIEKREKGAEDPLIKTGDQIYVPVNPWG